MDIYTYLTNDHRRIADLFNQVVDTSFIPFRSGVYEQIKSELLSYMDVKEATLYKGLARVGATEQDHIGHGIHAHAEIRQYFEIIGDISMSSDKWIEHFGELKHAFTHMVAVEERVIFAQARQSLPLDIATDMAEDARKIRDSTPEENPATA